MRYFVSILVLQSSRWGERERDGCFALFVFLVSRVCCVALPHDVTGLSVVCDCRISQTYSHTIFEFQSKQINCGWCHIKILIY